MARFFYPSSTIVTLCLSALIVIGGFASYHFGHFDGVSQQTLEEGYVRKEAITFDDLPTHLKKRYIDKEATIEMSKEGNLLDDVYLDEQGNPIPESEITPKDLRRMIQKLQKTLLFLQHDNLLIANEKSELTKKIEEMQLEQEEEKNELLKKNLEKINEAEQQHYRNISDLTLKINELQKENVIMAQKANIEANTLRSSIEELKAKAIENEALKHKAIKEAREDEQSKLVEYKEKIKLLNDQIALLNEQINTTNETAKSAFMRKQEEITKLKDELTASGKEKNELLTKHSATLATIDQKHRTEIAQYTTTIEQLKGDTEKLIAKHREAVSVLEEEQRKKLASYDEKIKSLTNELASNQKHIDALMLENEKDFAKFRAYLEDEKKRNKELTAASKKSEENAAALEKSLNATIVKQQETLIKKELDIKERDTKIAQMESDKRDIEAEIKQRVDANDRTHNKNYKIFNEKIASFDTAKRELVLKLDKQLDEYKATAEENHKKMQFHTAELTRANDELKRTSDAKEKELSEIKSTLSSLKIEQQKVLETHEAQLKEAKTALESLRITQKTHEGDAIAKVQSLEAALRGKDVALAALKREEGLKINALEKEIKSKEVDLIALKDEATRKEELLKSLQAKLNLHADALPKNAQKQIDELKEKLALVEKNRLASEAQLIALKEETKRKELDYLDQLKEAQKALKEKPSISSTQQSSSAQKANASKGEKLQLLETLSCTDMGTGVNAVSASCKSNVQALLAKYDRSYFFEVAPIVDNGGFASLKLIKSKKVGVEDSEIDRITGLANIGLGKARAKAGGELIESYLGEGAKISYALSNVEMDKARGFQIKVYR